MEGAIAGGDRVLPLPSLPMYPLAAYGPGMALKQQ